MSLQTEAMREGAGDKKLISAYQDEQGKWHGIEYVDHPTPSGCERWLPTYSDKRAWETKEQAIEEFKQALNG